MSHQKYNGYCPMCHEKAFVIFSDNQAHCHACNLIDPEAIDLTDLDKLKLEFLL